MKRDFFQVVAVQLPWYRFTTWMLRKCIRRSSNPKKLVVLQPFTFYLLNHLSKKNKRCWPLLWSKNELIRQVFLWYKFNSSAFKRKHSRPTTQLRKILTDNTTILEHQNNKQKLQILEALHIRNMQPTLNRINFQTSANVFSYWHYL